MGLFMEGMAVSPRRRPRGMWIHRARQQKKQNRNSDRKGNSGENELDAKIYHFFVTVKE
jgi:hypothetical protein